ncbi:MAG: hypothetical protein QXZ31_06980, partial [Thermofilaceae archaeon]
MRWIVFLALAVMLLAVGAVLWRRESAPGDAPLAASGYVIVDVDGKIVYRGEMHSFTEWGKQVLAARLINFTPNSPACIFHPYFMRVGYGGAGYSDSFVARAYGYNSTHVWVTVTGVFYADSDLTLSWVSLMEVYGLDGNPHAVTNDTLPGVQVPSGSVYSVVIAIYWRDSGALTENFAKYFLSLMPEPYVHWTVVTRSGGNVSLFFFGPRGDPWTCNDGLPWYSGSESTRMYLIVSNRSNPPPPSRSDYDMPEIARYTVSYSLTGRGVAIAATIQVKA